MTAPATRTPCSAAADSSAEVAGAGATRARWLVGVDGGGSGTRARLRRGDGTVLGFGSAGPSGLSQGIPQAWCHVTMAIAGAFEQAGLSLPPPPAIALGLGLAGAGVPSLRAAFLAADPGYAHCVLDTDAATQLNGVHAGRHGIVVACGTGSVAAVRDAQGRTRQVGGWGFPVGDEGSGAWLGLRALQHAQAVLDGRSPAGELSTRVLSAVGIDTAAVLAWCAMAGQAAYATLAPRVFEADAAGDSHAQLLLHHAADELARLVAAIDQHSPAAAALPIAVVGSIGERLVTRWPESLRRRVVEPAGDSADGAWRLLLAALDADAAGNTPTHTASAAASCR